MHEAHEGFSDGTLNTLSLEGEGRVSEESASLISCLFFVKNAPTLIRPPATFSLIGRRKIVARTRNELSGEGLLFQPSIGDAHGVARTAESGAQCRLPDFRGNGL
ncbi:MAG TPA: hypothetical protein DEB49_03275 [Verrucomicrobiales bacterium]|nr:hypothetical protein [Verrucomicrobiales bacterium]